MIKIALVKFGDNASEYSYITNYNDLIPGDTLIVQANNGYSVATFSRYTNMIQYRNKAEKCIVAKLNIAKVKEYCSKLIMAKEINMNNRRKVN